MTSIRNTLVALFAGLFLAACSDASDTPASSSGADQVLQALQAARPDLEYTDIRESSVPGYYHVAVGNETLYASEDGTHFFLGFLYNLEPGGFVNATEIERSSQRIGQLASIDQEGIIVFPAVGETKGILRVFTDVTCGFCRRLHEEVGELNAAGVEVQYFAYPRSGIERNGAYTHEFMETVKAWCVEPADRPDVLTRLKQGENLDIGVCEDNPVALHYALGRQFGVTGTPAILLPDGTLVPGYRQAAEFVQLLGITN